MRINFHNRGQSLIGIIIILIVVGLISCGLYYYYLQKQIPEVSEIPEKPKEEVVPSEEIAPPEEVVPPKEEIPTEEVKPEITCQNECSPTGSKKCSNNGYQICGNYDADNCLEWSTITNCPACQYCQGATSGSCVNRPNNTQDITSPNTCSATCKKCSGGACVNQASGENLFSQCTGAYSCSGFVTRLRNMCNGSGACADIDAAASDCSGTCSSYCSGGSCISTNTGAGTCTVATDARVASGGTGHCASGNCVADYYTIETACSTGSQCYSGNCYVDADGDRYAPSSGTKKCQDNSQLAGTDCNDANASIYPGTSGGSTCSICNSDGTITYQASNQDLFNHCGTTGCYTGNCSGTGSTCGYYTSGQGNCPACQTCQGATSGSCVKMATYNDSEGSNTCAGTCAAYCSSGSCISTNTGAGTCTVATDARVASGGTGHCASGNCLADYACDDSVTFTYKGSSVTYGIVESQGECWMDRNLGVSRKATAYNDSLAYGDLFQWGRLDDGHQTRTSGKTTTLSTTDVPGHSNFIYGQTSGPYDWRNPQNDNLWQGVSGINNPCPSGWRLPTRAEWDTERLSWSSNDWGDGAFTSPLKLTAAGYRNYSDASLGGMGSYGYYWSSTVIATAAGYLDLSTWAGAYTMGTARPRGFSVRCIKD